MGVGELAAPVVTESWVGGCVCVCGQHGAPLFGQRQVPWRYTTFLGGLRCGDC